MTDNAISTEDTNPRTLGIRCALLALEQGNHAHEAPDEPQRGDWEAFDAAGFNRESEEAKDFYDGYRDTINAACEDETAEIRDVLDNVTVTYEGEERVTYAECLIAVSQDLNGTLPDETTTVTYEHRCSREKAARVWQEHHELLADLFDQACKNPGAFEL